MKQEEYILLDLDPNTEHCAEAPRHKTGEKDRFTEPISSAAAETPAKAAKKAKTIYKVRLKMIRWPRKNSSKGETVVKKQSAAVQKTSLDNLIDDPSWFMIDNPSPGSASEIESSDGSSTATDSTHSSQHQGQQDSIRIMKLEQLLNDEREQFAHTLDMYKLQIDEKDKEVAKLRSDLQHMLDEQSTKVAQTPAPVPVPVPEAVEFDQDQYDQLKVEIAERDATIQRLQQEVFDLRQQIIVYRAGDD